MPTLALNHHMDVVSADSSDWHYPPFEGIINNNLIYGRGAQDMKGVGVAHYMALRELNETGVQLKRTIHLIAVPDEEVGGFKGTAQWVQTKEFKELHIGYVLDEGLPSSDEQMLFIKITERRPLQILFTCQGKQAHGSKLECTNALHTMIDFLSLLTHYQNQQKRKAQSQDPGSLLSIHITSLHAGASFNTNNKAAGINIIPPYVTATADIRIPAQTKQIEILSFINNILSRFPTIRYQIVARVDDYETPDMTKTNFYEYVSKAILNNGKQVHNLHFQATTDLRYYIPYIKAGCGITPFTSKENLHGIDENITIQELELAKNIFKDIVRSFCQ